MCRVRRSYGASAEFIAVSVEYLAEPVPAYGGDSPEFPDVHDPDLESPDAAVLPPNLLDIAYCQLLARRRISTSASCL